MLKSFVMSVCFAACCLTLGGCSSKPEGNIATPEGVEATVTPENYDPSAEQSGETTQ